MCVAIKLLLDLDLASMPSCWRISNYNLVFCCGVVLKSFGLWLLYNKTKV